MKNASEKGIRINMKVEGEPAEWLEEWKRRGLVTSYTDAVIQALRVLHESITEFDIKQREKNNLE